jgi:hypothetical protein
MKEEEMCRNVAHMEDIRNIQRMLVGRPEEVSSGGNINMKL